MNRSNWWRLALVPALVLSLAACDSITGEDDSSSKDDFIIIGQSGDTYTLTGQTWQESCRQVEGNGYRSVLTFEKGKVTFIDYTYSDAGAVCNNDETVDDEGEAKIKLQDEDELAGWSDTNMLVTPPTSLEGVLALDDPPTASVIEVTVQGSSFRTVWFMDDTDIDNDPDNLGFYGGTDEGDAVCSTSDGENCLRSDVIHTRID